MRADVVGYSACRAENAVGEQRSKTTKYVFPGVAQLVARVVWDHDAAGSNPVTRTKFRRKTAFLGGFSALKVQSLEFS